MYLASQNGYVKVVDLLIDSGAYINLHSQVGYSVLCCIKFEHITFMYRMVSHHSKLQLFKDILK